MANKPLKSIKFPGLPDTYIIEGLSETAKAALLACFRGVLWASEDGQALYNNLYAALYRDEPIEPYYDILKMSYSAGGIAPQNMFSWESETRTYKQKRLVSKLQLTNRASLRTVFPCTSGVVKAQDGYQICVYEFDGIAFASSNDQNPTTDTRNLFGITNGLNFNWPSDPNVTPRPTPDTPTWVDSYTIENPNCKYVLIAFRKTDNSDWTQSELQNMYGTVYTASLSPYRKLSEVANFKGGFSYTTGSIVKDEMVTETGFETSHKRNYVKEVAATARAVSGFLPIVNGIFKSADTTKYQLCVYQINFEGQIMWDINNPYVSATNGNPAWANEFDLSVSANKDDIFCVCISFKKLDNTEFTQEELSNMYGTVFTYEEAE